MKDNDDRLERLIELGIRIFKLSLVWVLTAFAINIAVVKIWPPERPELGLASLPVGPFGQIKFGLGFVWRTVNGPIGIGIGTAWWNLPGTILGFLLGLYLSGKRWMDDDDS